MSTCSFIKKLNLEENFALKEGFLRYLASFPVKFKNKSERCVKANQLTQKYIEVFETNNEVKSARTKSKSIHGSNISKFYNFSTDDLQKITGPKNLEDYKNQSKCISTLKARLMIFSLEVEGHYIRPLEKPTHQLHQAIMDQIFFNKKDLDQPSDIKGNTKRLNGYFNKKYIKKLFGTYQLYRKSFNNSFPDHIAVHVIKIFADTTDPDVICYQSMNSYEQFQNGEKNSPIYRVRMSSGHLFNYQGQMLFLGGTIYSHLNETENRSSINDISNDDEDEKFSYPELMMVNSHSGDTYNMRGLIMGHYPLLKLPVATSVYMSKLDKTASESIWDLENGHKDMSLHDYYLQGKHFGNIDPEIEVDRANKPENLEDKIPHSITEKYGNIGFKTVLPSFEHLSEDEKRVLEELMKKSVEKGKEKLHRKVKSIMKFVVNEIEGKYSKMLTP